VKSALFVLSINDVLCKEAFYGKDLILADRDMVETESDEILRDADTQNVSLLVVGDPFG
jgi:diphthine methyl ester synthase